MIGLALAFVLGFLAFPFGFIALGMLRAAVSIYLAERGL